MNRFDKYISKVWLRTKNTSELNHFWTCIRIIHMQFVGRSYIACNNNKFNIEANIVCMSIGF